MWCKILWNVVSLDRLRAGCMLVLRSDIQWLHRDVTRQTNDYIGWDALRCLAHSRWCNSKWFCHKELSNTNFDQFFEICNFCFRHFFIWVMVWMLFNYFKNCQLKDLSFHVTFVTFTPRFQLDFYLTCNGESAYSFSWIGLTWFESYNSLYLHMHIHTHIYSCNNERWCFCLNFSWSFVRSIGS